MIAQGILMTQHVLTGFTHESGFRVFTFDRVNGKGSRTKCIVRAEMALVREYGIPIQDLPLLCRGLLDHIEDREDESDALSITFAAEAMRGCADERAAARTAAANRRKPPRKPSRENAESEFGVQPA